jgi:hypothetical protein
LRLALFFSLLATSVAVAEVEGTTFRSTAFHVQLVAPRGWTLVDQAQFPETNYPGILMVATRAPAILSLAAQQLAPDESAKAFAQRNADALVKAGYPKVTPLVPRSGGVLTLDAQVGAKVMRQAYLTHGQTGYVVTLALPLSTSPAQMSDFFHELDTTLRGLSFGP